MKVVAIIQARMGSTRLPGKVLKKVLGKPLLAYQLERVGRSTKIDEIVVATTCHSGDNPIISLCQELDIAWYRGSEEDVLDRYFRTAMIARADIIVRLTADCPLIDPFQIDKVIETYLQHDHPYRFVSNTLKRTFPRGLDTEVFSFGALKKTHQEAINPIDREHVTRYMLHHPDLFPFVNVSSSTNYSHHRWTVDTIEDYRLIKRILEEIYPRNPKFTFSDTLKVLEENPEWQLINTSIQQKED